MPPDEGEAFVEGCQIGCKILHEVNLSSEVGGVFQMCGSC